MIYNQQALHQPQKSCQQQTASAGHITQRSMGQDSAGQSGHIKYPIVSQSNGNSAFHQPQAMANSASQFRVPQLVVQDVVQQQQVNARENYDIVNDAVALPIRSYFRPSGNLPSHTAPSVTQINVAEAGNCKSAIMISNNGNQGDANPHVSQIEKNQRMFDRMLLNPRCGAPMPQRTLPSQVQGQDQLSFAPVQQQIVSNGATAGIIQQHQPESMNTFHRVQLSQQTQPILTSHAVTNQSNHQLIPTNMVQIAAAIQPRNDTFTDRQRSTPAIDSSGKGADRQSMQLSIGIADPRNHASLCHGQPQHKQPNGQKVPGTTLVQCAGGVQVQTGSVYQAQKVGQIQLVLPSLKFEQRAKIQHPEQSSQPIVGQKRPQPKDFDNQNMIQKQDHVQQVNNGEYQLMNQSVAQSSESALHSQNSNKRQVREVRFNVREDNQSQQVPCKPQEKVCRQTQLLEYLKIVIEEQPDQDINDIIAPIPNRAKLYDQQSNFIKAVISGDYHKLKIYVHKINEFFDQRMLMIKNAEMILQSGQSFEVANIPELINNIIQFKTNQNLSQDAQEVGNYLDVEKQNMSTNFKPQSSQVKSYNEEYKSINFKKKIRQLKKCNSEKRHAAFNHFDINQFNALHYACRHGKFFMVQLLVEEAKISIEAKIASGYTPLHIAARNNSKQICEYLVERHRANVLVEGLEKDTPRKSAEELGHVEVAEYLLYHEKRMLKWQNRNCLLKICVNRKQTNVFKNVSLPIFKEIIKYA